MMKAIRITKDNKSKLEAQYSMDEGFLEFASGLYLVAGFGDDQYESILTPSGLTEVFFRTGRNLSDDYFEVQSKSSVVPEVQFSDAQG